MPSLQDFSLIRSHVERYQRDFNQDAPNAFYYFILDILLGLQYDEIQDSITDTNYLRRNSGEGGHDRGIDAIYIDSSDVKSTIHFFNCKYTSVFEKTNNNFPSGEIDKILSFLNDLLIQDPNMKNTVNPVLYDKVQEIWQLFLKESPNFRIHLCSNHYQGLSRDEKERFERSIERHSNFRVEYHLMDDFVQLVTRRGKQIVNAQLRAIDRNFFEKSDGDIRALVVNVDARDLIRIVLDSDEIRLKADINDYREIRNFEILENAFDDNVRVYLRQRSKINRNIKKTALSEECHRFFYFNNGITITCDNFEYMKTARSPIIELKNLQIVNGSQTIHALYEAFMEEPDRFEYIDVLCRIYETENSVLSTRIAEYTNSQNPVKSRDIRSIDYMQQKLESELAAKGYFYERKNNQHLGEPREKRIDAEKTGQVLFAFYNKMPTEAKNDKRLIFAEKYEEIFNDEINADKVLLAYSLFDRIESKKNSIKEQLTTVTTEEFEDEAFILYSSYHILYMMGELARQQNVELSFTNLPTILKFYDDAVYHLRNIINLEKQRLQGHKDTYNHIAFFKSSRPKKLFEEQILQMND